MLEMSSFMLEIRIGLQSVIMTALFLEQLLVLFFLLLDMVGVIHGIFVYIWFVGTHFIFF